MQLPKLRFLARQGVMQQICYRLKSTSGAAAATAANVCQPQTIDYLSLVTPERRANCMEAMSNLPPFRRPEIPHSKRENSSASVLIALCMERGTNEISLLYTRRSRHLRRHSLQIAFPGGLRDEEDASYIDCALRETEEEVGLPRHRIEIWGETSLMHFPRTAAIMPVVGVIPEFHVSELKLNPNEVEQAFCIPLRSLIAPESLHHTQFRTGYSGPVFIIGQHRVWGITAYFTYVFLRCLLPKDLLPTAMRTNVKYIRPYKLPPKTHHHKAESSETTSEEKQN